MISVPKQNKNIFNLFLLKALFLIIFILLKSIQSVFDTGP